MLVARKHVALEAEEGERSDEIPELAEAAV